jgi:hypothetical protein
MYYRDMFKKVTDEYRLIHENVIPSETYVDRSEKIIYLNPKTDYNYAFVKSTYVLSGEAKRLELNNNDLEIVVNNFLSIPLYRKYLDTIYMNNIENILLDETHLGK